MVHFLEPVEQFLCIAGPILTYEEHVLPAFFAYVLDPIAGEAFGEMLHGVEAEAFEVEFFGYPDTPVFDISDDFVVVVIDVA